MTSGESDDGQAPGPEAATTPESPPTLLDRLRCLMIRRGWAVALGAFAAMLVYGLITGSLKFYPDLALTSLRFAESGAPREITCRTREQNDLTAYLRIERSGAFPSNVSGSQTRLTVRTIDGESPNAHTFTEPLTYGQPATSSTEASVVRTNAMRIRLPSHLRDRSLAWTATVYHPHDSNVANRTLIGTLSLC